VARELGHGRGIAQAFTSLGYVALWAGDYPAARGLFEQGLPLWRALGHHQELLSTLGPLGATLRQLGEARSAYDLLEEQLALVREGNWSNHVPGALMQLGFSAGDLGRWEEAAAHCAESLRLRNGGPGDHHYDHHVALCLIGLSRVALAQGRPTRAARLLGATELLCIGHSHVRRVREQAASPVRAVMEPAEFETAWAAGQAAPLEQIIAEALEEAPAG
jgi:tetratricopeptide (TPR) repeat protein